MCDVCYFVLQIVFVNVCIERVSIVTYIYMYINIIIILDCFGCCAFTYQLSS